MTCPTPLLRPEQFERYRRHLSLPELGVEGQRRVERGEDFPLLDVRDSEDLEKTRIEGARPLPLGRVESRLGRLEE
jgi:hypothetical protein